MEGFRAVPATIPFTSYITPTLPFLKKNTEEQPKPLFKKCEAESGYFTFQSHNAVILHHLSIWSSRLHKNS